MNIIEAIESSSPEELAKLRELILKVLAGPPPTKCPSCIGQEKRHEQMRQLYGQNWCIGMPAEPCTCKELGLK